MVMKIQHIKLRGQIYWFQRRVPQKLHAVLGDRMVSISLHTRDLSTAILARDKINAEWAQMMRTQKPSALYAKRLQEITAHADFDDDAGWVNEHLINDLQDSRAKTLNDAEPIFKQYSDADVAAFFAWRKATQEVQPPSQYQYSLRDGLTAILDYKRGKVEKGMLDKYVRSVAVFLGDDDNDCALEPIRKSQVVKWIDTLDHASGTMNIYLSCLATIFEHAQDREHINEQLVNPFKRVNVGKKEVKSYKMMDDDLLSEILSHLKEDDHLPPLIARATGMRLSEVFNASLEIHDGIYCFSIKPNGEYRGGKTDAGNRLVPIPLKLVDDVLAHQPTWTNNAAFSKRFGKAKAKVINCRQTSFHSLRVSFITYAQRQGYTEQNVAWLVGHESGKGDAMTGQLYFKGYTLQLMQEIIESVPPYVSH